MDMAALKIRCLRSYPCSFVNNGLAIAIKSCDHPFSWVLGAAQRHDDSSDDNPFYSTNDGGKTWTLFDRQRTFDSTLSWSASGTL